MSVIFIYTWIKEKNKNRKSEKKNLRFEHELIRRIKLLDDSDNFSQWVKDACWQRVERDSVNSGAKTGAENEINSKVVNDDERL